MARTLIQKHSTSIVRAMVEKVNSLSDLQHKLTKGELRELFVTDVLQYFLTSQFSIGSGVIVNWTGDQSNQIDIVVYDNRVLPPFVQARGKGVYPAESVIATIEVKSWLRKPDLLETEKKAQALRKKVFNPDRTLYKHFSKYRTYCNSIPLCGVIGFYGDGVKELRNNESGKKWLNENINSLFAICLVKKHSWMKVGEPSWSMISYNRETSEEIKRFLAVLLDNIRSLSEIRFEFLVQEHRDWFSAYIRK